MKVNTNSFLLYIGITSVFLCVLIEASITIPRSYIVEYAHQDDKLNDHKIITDDLSQYKDLFQIHHTYSSTIFQGMSLTLKDAQSVSYDAADKDHLVLAHLQNHPAIKNIYPIYEVPRPQALPSQRNVTFPYSNEDSQIYDFHQKLGITGEGILIGVLDSGIYICPFSSFFFSLFQQAPWMIDHDLCNHVFFRTLRAIIISITLIIKGAYSFSQNKEEERARGVGVMINNMRFTDPSSRY